MPRNIKRFRFINGKLMFEDKIAYANGEFAFFDDLEQIAEHLLVYCKHNREEYEH